MMAVMMAKQTASTIIIGPPSRNSPCTNVIDCMLYTSSPTTPED